MEQDSTRQIDLSLSMEGNERGLHPAVDGQRLSEVQ